ncbi:esterase family protein [Actinomadura sp. KC216]|uniref:alpha/beta hydrolase n=1 Tax=Actinomadura sp. KC216 TaxID=2530370 RepID=UPI00104B05FA|nr:alpha/beta hydrolase family protein [Actinomadura sp. KC216]TDB83916.1 esterase family protein [Actinomadura sp. KC216]
MGLRGLAGAGFIVGIAGLTATIAPGGPAGGPPGGAARKAAPADDGAIVIGERRPRRRVLDLAIRSPVLDDVGRARLLLPARWSRDASRRWPVLWLLHGAGAGGGSSSGARPLDGGGRGLEDGGHTAWTDHTDIEELTEDADVIVVMPDGGPCGNYTDWWNRGGGGTPKWETFHLAELRQILERGYRAGPDRAVAGNAMGGLGALSYAARHRGLFRAAASFSGPVHTLYRDPAGLDVADLVELGVAIGAPSLDWTEVWGDPDEQRAVWRQHNPYDLADRLAGVRLHVSSGDGAPGPYDRRPGTGGKAAEPLDAVEALAHTVSQEFAGKLRKLGIPVSAHFYRGTHTWPYWRRELRATLPALLAEIT